MAPVRHGSVAGIKIRRRTSAADNPSRIRAGAVAVARRSCRTAGVGLSPSDRRRRGGVQSKSKCSSGESVGPGRVEPGGGVAVILAAEQAAEQSPRAPAGPRAGRRLGSGQGGRRLGDAERPDHDGVAVASIICIPIIVAALGLWLWMWNRVGLQVGRGSRGRASGRPPSRSRPGRGRRSARRRGRGRGGPRPRAPPAWRCTRRPSAPRRPSGFSARKTSARPGSSSRKRTRGGRAGAARTRASGAGRIGAWISEPISGRGRDGPSLGSSGSRRALPAGEGLGQRVLGDRQRRARAARGAGGSRGSPGPPRRRRTRGRAPPWRTGPRPPPARTPRPR